MGRDTQEPALAEPFPTAAPGVYSVMVMVPKNIFRPDMTPALGVAYKNSPDALPRVRVETWGDYIFTGPADSAPEGYIGLWFGPAMTAAQASAPWRTRGKFDQHSWDSVILGLAPIPDRKGLRSTVAAVNSAKTILSGPSYYMRAVVIPEGNYGTEFVIDEFLSPIKRGVGWHQTPVPTLVSYDIPGRQGSFIGLHKKLRIDNVTTVSGSVSGETGGATSGVIAGQEFPATDMVTWERHVIYEDEEFVNGMWTGVRISVLPPPMPKATSR